MNALIAEVAVAVVPEPVPGVVEAILRELALGSRAEPEVIVDTGGHSLGSRAANSVAALEAEAASHIDVADEAFPHLGHSFLRPAVRACIHTTLADLIAVL